MSLVQDLPTLFPINDDLFGLNFLLFLSDPHLAKKTDVCFTISSTQKDDIQIFLLSQNISYSHQCITS